MRLPYVRALSIAALVVVGGCKAKVANVEVSPPTVAFDTDVGSKKLVLVLKDPDGNVIEEARPTTYASKDPAIATVDANGVVKPAGTGKTTITATVEEASAMASVEVVLLKRIQLQTPALVIVAGTSSDKLGINYMNERGEALEVDLAKKPKWKPVWKVADAAIATVSEDGVIAGVAAGSTSVVVEVGELKTELKLTVNPAPEPEPVPEPEPDPKNKKKK